MRLSRLLVGIAAATLLSAAPVHAQQSGPLTLEPIASSFVLAPDVKVTSVHGTTGVLVGGYGGRLVEQRVLVGGAAYVLADSHDRARLFYAGLLLGGRLFGDERLNVTTRALVGVGRGTAYETVTFAQLPVSRHNLRHPVFTDSSGGFRIGIRDDFAVLEPEVRLALRLTRGLSAQLGGGYRVTSADGWLNEAFRGATGSVGVQMEFGAR